MKHIVIVENDSGILEQMMIILKHSGHYVTGIFDGSVILNDDYNLPDIFIVDKHLQGIAKSSGAFSINQ